MGRSIRVGDVERLALGASFLAAGGGGDPYHAVLMAQESLTRHGPVLLVSPTELPPDALLLPVIVGGPPSAVIEALPSTDQILHLRQIVESTLGATCVAVLPIQIGPVNAVFPLVAAAELGLPCVDADIMQHCFPSLEMTLLALSGLPMSPIVMVDAMGAFSIQQAGTDRGGSRLLRATLAEMGMVALISAYSVTASVCARNASIGSISRCIELGALVAALRGGGCHALEECLRFTGGVVVFEGVVLERHTDLTAGVPHGVITAIGESADQRILRLDHGSETVAATVDGVIVAVTPDVLTLIDIDTGAVLQTPDIVRGQRLRVVSVPGNDRWYTPEAARLIHSVMPTWTAVDEWR